MDKMEIVTIGKGELKELIREAVRTELDQREKRITLLTVKEAATALKIHPQTLYKLKEKIGFIRQGNGVLFTQTDLDNYVQANRIKI